LAGGQGELALGLDAKTVSVGGSGPLQIVSSRMTSLWEALCAGYDQLGLDEATGGNQVFRQLVLARIIEPTSKADSLRVLAEAGIDAVSYATASQRLGPGVGSDLERRPNGGADGRVKRCAGPAMHSRPPGSGQGCSWGASTGPVMPPTITSAVTRVLSFCHARRRRPPEAQSRASVPVLHDW
jgi:hypothetical protein